ncbi:MAG: O-antigen ligase family protein [Jannaschia sp.]
MTFVSPALSVDIGASHRSHRQTSSTFWAFVDLALLVGALIASLDMLINLRPIQSIVWLLCYGTALLRVAMVWPLFLPMLMRSGVILIYPAICLVSVVWSSTKGYSLEAALQLSMTILIALYLGWRYSIAALIKAAAGVMAVGVMLSLLHLATGIFPWPVHTRAGGLAGLFSHKNMLGLRSVFCMTAMLTILMMARAEVSQRARIVATAVLLASLLTVALSQAMTAVALVPMMGGIVLLLCVRRLPSGLAIVLIAIAVLAVALGPLILAVLGTNPVDAGLGALGKNSSLTGRTTLWQVAWDVHRDHPILGVGYRTFWQAPEFMNARLMTAEAGATTSVAFHNFILEILVSAGWTAVAAMFALIALAVRRLWRLFALTRSPAVAGALALVFGIVVSSLFGTTLFRGHDSMIILLVAFAVSASEELRRQTVQRGAR